MQQSSESMPQVFGPAAGEWQPVSPRYARDLLADSTARWWIAGGWAIDLFLGHRSREHKDLDIGILRPATLEVLAALAGWEFFEAQRGVLFHLTPGTPPRAAVNSLWGRPMGTSTWVLELVLNDSLDDRLVFRRCSRIELPLARAIRHNAEGLPYLAPEMQLLYKARRPARLQDQADFDSAVPHLSAEAARWLRESLAIAEPGHPWLTHAHFAR